MPSMSAVRISAALDLPPRAPVVDQGAESIQAQLGGVAVGLVLGVEPLRRIADGGVREAHAPVEPSPAAQAADDRNGNRTHDRRTGNGTGVPEVQNRGAGIFQSLCFLHQFFGRKVLAMELGKDRDARAGDCLHHTGIAQDFHHVRPSLFREAEGGADCGVDSFLRRAIGYIAADQGALRATAHGLAADEHLVDGDFGVRRASFAGERKSSACLPSLYLVEEAPASRSIAEMIAPGSARFFPAMSSALPCATEENSTGVPSVSAAVPEKACVFAMMWPWSWVMTTKAS